MTRTKRDPEGARTAILDASEALLRDRGAAGVTVEGVARRAGYAKGLVLYHFKTKLGLLEATARRLSEHREKKWKEAFDNGDPMTAVDATWALLTDESESGVTRAWISLVGPGRHITDQTVSELHERFSTCVGKATARLMAGIEHRFSIPEAEVGWLLASVVHGMGLSLLGGADRGTLSGAYAAAWLGVLSLARQDV